jgi:hypothetical protein
MPRTLRIHTTLALPSVALLLAACADPARTPTTATAPAASVAAAGVHRQYGTPVKVGGGRARAYVTLDQKNGGVALELGVAFDEQAMEGLPAAGSGEHGPHGEMHEHILQLPERHGTTFQFVELNWNPGGHEPPGVYDKPHFDFHFYTTSKAERDAIDPAAPDYAAKANRLPGAEFIPQFYSLPLPPGVPPVAAAVPRMGVHMLDMRSPEIQGMLGNPAGYRPFTTTFIQGSWDGRVTFYEPMITREHILARRAATTPDERDVVIQLPTAQRYSPAGRYPSAYRIAWDEQAKEYRIALTQLADRS